jgi:hypothetical protein
MKKKRRGVRTYKESVQELTRRMGLWQISTQYSASLRSRFCRSGSSKSWTKYEFFPNHPFDHLRRYVLVPRVRDV